jgi:AraC family transcriptional activator of pobA
MLRFRSLLIDRVDLRLPGLGIFALAVHRHLPELNSIGLHRHGSDQALLYLSGGGWQALGRDRVAVAAGSIVAIPAGIWHGFERAEGRAPLCLAIDFRLRDGRRHLPGVSLLHRSELAQLRQSVADLRRHEMAPNGSLRCEGSALVLQILIGLLRSAGWLRRETPAPARPRRRPILALIAGADLTAPLAETVQRSGYHRDYLNTLVKRETGLTLGQHRAQRRLALAKRMLGEGVRVSEIALAAGLPDQSYFARWFRGQTGQAPTRWLRAVTARNRVPSDAPSPKRGGILRCQMSNRS